MCGDASGDGGDGAGRRRVLGWGEEAGEGSDEEGGGGGEGCGSGEGAEGGAEWEMLGLERGGGSAVKDREG